jgi:hypothetical protein
VRNLCFTERSLKVSRFALKSLGSPISLSSLSVLPLSLASLSFLLPPAMAPRGSPPLCPPTQRGAGHGAAGGGDRAARRAGPREPTRCSAARAAQAQARGRWHRRWCGARGGRLWLASGGARRGRAARAAPSGREWLAARHARRCRCRRVSGTRARRRWSGQPRARGGTVGVELRRTRLGHVQVRRDKAGASAGPATGGRGVARSGRACSRGTRKRAKE